MGRRDLPIRHDVVIPGRELREAASRSSGPGGQHLQKTSTRVTLRWNVATSQALSASQRARLLEGLASRLTRGGELVVHAGQRRSRARNRELARERLAELVRAALARRRRRVATRPTPTSRARRLATKRRRGETKRGRARVRGEEP